LRNNTQNFVSLFIILSFTDSYFSTIDVYVLQSYFESMYFGVQNNGIYFDFAAFLNWKRFKLMHWKWILVLCLCAFLGTTCLFYVSVMKPLVQLKSRSPVWPLEYVASSCVKWSWSPVALRSQVRVQVLELTVKYNPSTRYSQGSL